MNRPVLHTPRIELRPMAPEHLPLLHTLDSDPEVMRYILGRARAPAETDEFWGPRCADTSADALGLGWWVGFQDDEFLGWWDLGRSDPEPDTAPALQSTGRVGGTGMRLAGPEIGWRLRRDRWRQGLASEGAAALLAHAFDTVDADLVWATTMAVNAGSRGVMRRIGMRHIRTDHPVWHAPLPGADQGEVVYRVTAEEWRGR